MTTNEYLTNRIVQVQCNFSDPTARGTATGQVPTFYINRNGNGPDLLRATVADIVPNVIPASVVLMDMTTGEVL